LFIVKAHFYDLSCLYVATRDGAPTTAFDTPTLSVEMYLTCLQ
jgi:hypothetical protein